MDAAIYESTSQKIFGVRGQWLFQFNSSTGVQEAALRISPSVIGRSSITAFGGKLYVGVTCSPKVDSSAFPSSYNLRDIFVVNAATFTLISSLGLYTKMGSVGFADADLYWHKGWDGLQNDGTNLIGYADGKLFKVNPTNTATYTSQSAGGIPSDVCYDADHNVLWEADPFSPNIWAFDANNFLMDTYNSGSVSTFTAGLTYLSSLQKVYFVDQSFNINYIDASNIVAQIAGSIQFAFTTKSTARINATSFRVKAVNGFPGNPYNNKILIPTWDDDAVLVWNPITDNIADMVTKTGFTSPFDIVSTPTKNFAVQTGVVGLKEIL